MKTIRIRTQRDSEESVVVCRSDALKQLKGGSFVFTDDNVYPLYRALIARYLPNVPVYAMPAGEEHKTPETLFALLAAMARAGLHRGDTLVCVGGGVVGDVGGLAAGLYMRGINCVQVPTTLLAQVDSSVGGKTAVDFNGVKNLVGMFRQPAQVLVDRVFLKTLPEREIRCGLGEIVKHGALDCALFEKLRAGSDRLFDVDFLAELVPENIAFKADVVQKDPHEKGLRKCLNLGHTTGHALELSHKTLSHGEYVLIGIIFEAELAKRHTQCDIAYLNELEALALNALKGLPPLPDMERAARLALLDKKNNVSDKVVVTAPTACGQYQLLELPFGVYARETEEIRRMLCCV